MKIFFALALACSVVLGLDDCGAGQSDDCISEFDADEDAALTRCEEEGGSNPLRYRCSKCCPDSNCDATCGCGFTKTTSGLGYDGQSWSYPGDTLDSCATECRNREGCTSFEYNEGGDEAVGGLNKCGTYTGGSANILTTDQKATWVSCIIEDWFPGKKTSADGSSNKISARRWF